MMTRNQSFPILPVRGKGLRSETDFQSTPRFLLTTEAELHGEDTEEKGEIVRRIHACVTACEGWMPEKASNLF